MSIKDGGQAFPKSEGETSADHNGMTLRDWFAGQALAGLAGNPPRRSTPHESRLVLAKAAYEVADAMLAARGGDQ